MNYYIYLLPNSNRNVLYVGATNDLVRRVYERKHHLDKGSFTDRYNVDQLVYYECAGDPYHAIERKSKSKAGNEGEKKS